MTGRERDEEEFASPEFDKALSDSLNEYRNRQVGGFTFTTLNPEAHEDSLKISRDLWAEALKTVAENEAVVVTSETGDKLTIFRGKGDRTFQSAPANTDLSIRRRTQTANEELRIVQEMEEIYDFTPAFVLRTTSTLTFEPGSFQFKRALFDPIARGMPNGDREVQREEADRDRLTTILSVLRDPKLEKIPLR